MLPEEPTFQIPFYKEAAMSCTFGSNELGNTLKHQKKRFHGSQLKIEPVFKSIYYSNEFINIYFIKLMIFET